jgi:hypothetical protein
MDKTKPTENHPDSALIDLLGGTAVVARMVGVKSPSISEWRKAGIPSARRQYLAVIRPDVFFAKPAKPTDQRANEVKNKAAYFHRPA